MTPSIVTFRQNIKINVSDYTKLKEDSQWRSFQRQLSATAANHDTLDILNPKYIPPADLSVAWDQKQKFMFNVFTQCILTSKGRVCVRQFETTMDAQNVYAALLSVYHDNFSASLEASTLRSELTVMKLDDKWRKGFETFLTHWSSKIQELESIEDKLVDDDTKRIWLTNALLGHKDMDDAVRQAVTTELTICGMAGGNATHVSWTNFYRIVTTTAKLLDKSKQIKSTTQRQAHRSEQLQSGRGGRGSGSGRGFSRGGGHQRGGRGAGQHRTFTTYTGPNMVLTSNMFFSKDDWHNKLTEAQRTKLKDLKREKLHKTSVSSNTSVVQVHSTNLQPSSIIPTPVCLQPSLPGNPIRNLLSNAAARAPTEPDPSSTVSPPRQVSFAGNTYTMNHCDIVYNISQQEIHAGTGALLDGGANGGMSGSDVKLIHQSLSSADVTGIADKSVNNLPLCSVAALIETHKGPIIGFFHQYAHYGKGKTIHSINQMKHFGILINDTPGVLSGCQPHIKTPDGYCIPISIRNGLPYMDMTPPTDQEMEHYPHVFFTSDMPWDPTVLDSEFSAQDILLEEDEPMTPYYYPSHLNDYGEIIKYETDFHELDRTDLNAGLAPIFYSNPHLVRPKVQNFNMLKPNFGFAPAIRIQKTLENTTQFARLDTRLPLRKHYKSRFPAANVSRLNETVATDTFFSDVVAADVGILGHGGATMLQLFCGTTSLLTAGYPMKEGDEMASTLEDFIRQHGAPNALFSDNAKNQVGRAVHDILRMYAIKDFQCEPYHQHQNFAERRIQEVKALSNRLMDITNTNPIYWLLCVQYSIYLLNRLSTDRLDWKTPIEAATGQQPDVSALLAFRWYEPVYVKDPLKQPYPSSTSERSGRIVGIAEHQGDALTFLVLDDITGHVVTRSELRSALGDASPNLRATSSSDGGEISSNDGFKIQSSADVAGTVVNPSDLKLPKFTPQELIGQTFTHDIGDGKAYKAKVVRQIMDKEAEDRKQVKFLIEIGDGELEELISYHELADIIEKQEEDELNPLDKVWTFKAIRDHQGPLTSKHPDYMGSRYNVLVQWDDDSETWEPLDIMIKDDPITLAAYAEENDLLDKPGFKRLQRISKNKKRYKRLLNQSKQAHKKGPVFQFGIQVPRNVKEAYELDKKNGNTLWSDAMKEEVASLLEYTTFRDEGPIQFLAGYKRIIVQFVFAVKHDLRHKARLVAGGHLTPATLEGTYSGVVSVRSLRICLVAGELNRLRVMVGDVSSAYLEAFTQEKVYFIAGPEFGELEGHLLVIVRALYGLRTSGARWHDRFADTLRSMGYNPCKADPDVWMKDCGTHYEYVCVYVDDLMVIGKNPEVFMEALTTKYKYKLKGVGSPSYHLGGDFFRDPDGTLAWGASSYIKKMIINYTTMFGEKPKEASSPMVEKDHPELDTTEELDATGIKQYQSLIGALQWLVTFGRFDILLGVTTMSGYRVAPRIGHLERLKRMYGYIKRHPDGAIRFRVKIPDHESQGMPMEYDWSQAVYGKIQEELPYDMPTPKGKSIRITTYNDANLMHDFITGRSMSGVLHFINQTPVQWFAKKQNVVETATYGSEFMVARQATEQIMDLRYTLRMLGIPIDGPAWLFGDNQSVLTSSTIPHSSLNKRHNALSYHRVRESIAAKIIYFMHVKGEHNPSDMFTKFLGWTKFWPLIQPLLFWKGETMKKENEDKPISVVIKEIKDAVNPSSELRGVTNTND